MTEPGLLITRESPRQIIFEDFKIDLPISGGWGYDIETACVIDKNASTVIKGIPLAEFEVTDVKNFEELLMGFLDIRATNSANSLMMDDYQKFFV